MARELSEINNSGELDNLQLGDTSTSKKAVTEETMIAYVAQELANLEAGSTVEQVDFDPLLIPPAQQSGRIFFDQGSQSLSVYSDVSDFTLNLGQEGVTRVYNDTGSIILNGSVCTALGSFEGFPKAILALADDYETSRVLGVATHDIPNGTFGFVTNIGSLLFDDTALVIDEMIYLSDTVPGGMTNTPPNFASVIGVKMSDTRILVNINNHKSIPTAIGWLYDLSAQTYNLIAAAASTPLINFAGSDYIFLTADPVTGELEVPYAGVYEVTATFSATFTADGKTGRTFFLTLEDTTDGLPLADFGFPIPEDFETITGSIVAPFRITELHHLRLGVSVTGDDVSGVVFQNINFAVKSIQIK